MKKYKVTLRLMVDPSRDTDPQKPRLRNSIHIVEAGSRSEAEQKAQQNEESKLSVFNIQTKQL